MGYLTQTWLAVSNDAAATVSGGYWYHGSGRRPQHKLVTRLSRTS